MSPENIVSKMKKSQEKVISFLERHEDEVFTIDDVAGAVGVSY
jgi:hypothetical protein